MAAGGKRVRQGHSAPRSARPTTLAVTGATGELGTRLLHRLAQLDDAPKLVGIDTARGNVAGVAWRLADVRDPALRARLRGVDALVHLAADRTLDASPVDRRAVNIRGTQSVLEAAAAAGVSRVVLVTSAMVYGARPDNPIPLPEDASIAAEPDAGLVGDWVEVERLVDDAARAEAAPRVVVVRPASLVGPVSDPLLPRLFEAPRLLAFRGVEAHWQLCHVDDLVSSLEWAALGRVDGPITVGCDGWLSHDDVERITGLRSLVVPSAMAFGTAERLQRVGVLPAPASELHYLAHPWVVGSQRLHEAGWAPAWDNAGALRAHLDGLGEQAARGVLARIDRKDATRAAAGATVALVGTLAVARARAARRRRRG